MPIDDFSIMPCHWPNEVTSKQDLFDPEGMIDRIVMLLRENTTQGIVIEGLPKSGKSSNLNAIADSLKLEASQIIPIMLTTFTMPVTLNRIAWEILGTIRKFRRKYQEAPAINYLDNSQINFTNAAEAVEHCKELLQGLPDLKFAILWDEVDSCLKRLTSRGQNNEKLALLEFIERITKDHELLLIPVMTLSDVEPLKHPHSSSQFLESFDKFPVIKATRANIKNFMTQMDVRQHFQKKDQSFRWSAKPITYDLEPNVDPFIFHLTNGNCYLIKALMAAFSQHELVNWENQIISVPIVESVVNELMENSKPYAGVSEPLCSSLFNIFNERDEFDQHEQGLMKYMAKLGRYETIKQDFLEAQNPNWAAPVVENQTPIDRLVKRGILYVDMTNNDQKIVGWGTDLWREYLRRLIELPGDSETSVMVIHGLSKSVYIGGEPVALTELRRDILFVLAQNINNFVPTSELCEQIYGHDIGNNSGITSGIYYLKKDIEELAPNVQFIESERSKGYRLVNAKYEPDR